MAPHTRRTFLRTSLGAGAGAVIPYMVRDRALAEAPAARLNDIDHFIIVMQENRSFDHYFGSLSGVRGFADALTQRLASGDTVLRQPDPFNPAGFTAPFHLDTTATSAQQLRDLSHAWDAQHFALNGGKMDSWLPSHRAADGEFGPLTMGYFTRADLPFYYALADAFTICDNYFCSVLGPTYPNRLYHWTATIDPDATGGGPVIDNDAVDGHKIYAWETYPERLQRAGISWQIAYDVVDDYLLNVVPYFAAFRNAPAASPLREQAMNGKPFDRFLADVRSGNLPQVTWVLGHADQCEHPRYLPAAGANFVQTILAALWSNPSLWAKTAFVLNYDENDGLFDHVVPPTPEPGTPGEFIDGRPIGLGFRVPCLIVSPFARGGYVCSDTFDHTSVLQMLEARFGVEVANLTPWRRRTTSGLHAALGLGSPPRYDVPKFPSTAQALVVAEKQIKLLPPPRVPSVQRLPEQEPGTRPRRGASIPVA